MTARLIGVLVMVVLTGCATHKSAVIVRESVPAATVVVPSTPPVEHVPEIETVLRVPLTEPELPPSIAPSPEKPAPATPVSGLLASVQAAVAAGKLDQGAALSERALRISPRDAQLWYQLALIRYRQNRLDAAADAAKRARSLAGKDVALQQQINSLLQELAGKDASKSVR